MSSTYEIREFAPADFEAVRRLYSELYPGRIKSENYDRMRLTETVDGLCEATVAFSNDACVGFYEVWPLILTNGSETIKGGQSIDTMTHPEHQGKGLFTKLAKQCYLNCGKRGMQLLIGIPNRNSAPGFLNRLSWSQPDSVTQWFSPVSGAGLPGFLSKAAEAATRWLPRGFGMKCDVAASSPGDSDLARFLEKREKDENWRIKKDVAWYKYRYQPASRYDYQWYCSYVNGEMTGFVIISYSLEKADGPKAAHIAEIAGDSIGIRSALASAIKDARLKRFTYLSIFTTDRALRRTLITSGFIPGRKFPLIVRAVSGHSHRLNPFKKGIWNLTGGDFDFI